MKPTIIIQILALPVILAEYLELVIVAPDDTYAIVAGKKDPGEAVVIMMNSTTPGFDQRPRCMDDDGNWKQDGCDATRHKIYQQVGQLDFDGNNRYPRRFVIEVGPPCEETHIWICDATVTAGGNYVWDVVNGFLPQNADDAVKVACGDRLTRGDVREQAESGTDSEKELWAMVLEASDAAMSG